MEEWFEKLPDILRAGEAAVLVTVVASKGSAPREAGTKMLVWHDGFAGTIGGGNLDVDDATTSTRFEKDSAPAQTISDVQLRYRLGAVDTEFYVGINNVFDQEPPTFALPFAARNAGISEITSITAGLYDLVGRFFYAGARVAF